jgi:uncharacterized iron-regulated protein
MRGMVGRRAVLLGETHDDAEIHRWQLQVATCLHLLCPGLALGFEMFPRHVQPVLDRWVAGALGTAEFLQAVTWREIWNFDPELYLPLLHFCRQQKLRMLALNCRRSLVTQVGLHGWDAVPEAERDGVTPAAAPTEGHRSYLAGLTGMTPAGVSDRFLRAQQVWDRAFACRIAEALQAPQPDGSRIPLVIGIIGRGHLEYGHGTPHQLKSLGIADPAVLLPTGQAEHDADQISGVGDAVFRLDRSEVLQAAPIV